MSPLIELVVSLGLMTEARGREIDAWAEDLARQVAAGTLSETEQDAAIVARINADVGNLDGEPHWLTKDFNVLYRVTRDLLLAVGSGDSTRTARALNDAANQLTRLRTAFAVTEAARVRSRKG